MNESIPLIYHPENRIGRITINREAQRNALSPESLTLFHEALDGAEADAEVRVVCVTGAGDQAFCAGADLGGMSADSGSVIANYANLLKRLAGFPKPVVARVNGTCMAGGLGIMLACDIVIACRDARFGAPEVNVGLFPMMIGALIYRNVPRKKAMEMVLTGRRLTAEEALEMGLVTRIVAREDLDATMLPTHFEGVLPADPGKIVAYAEVCRPLSRSPASRIFWFAFFHVEEKEQRESPPT